MEKTKIEQFYKQWQIVLPQRIDSYIYDDKGELLPTRFIFTKLKKIIEKFLKNEISEIEKITLMPGIRGIGKSTLLAQIFALEKFLDPKKDKEILEHIGKLDERLYIDVGQMLLEQITLNDFFKFYEEIKQIQFEKPDKKIIILIDEIHFDENWCLFLKNLFDRTKGNKDILVIATGSSALKLNMLADLGRRVDIINVFPMKFNEYLILKYNKYPLTGLSDELQEIIFNSLNAKDVFKKLQLKEAEINRYFANEVPLKSENDFFDVGGFPFIIKIENIQKAMEKVKNVIDGIIVKDILKLKKFETHTVAKVNDLLYLLAQSDLVSYQKLQVALKIKRPETLENLIEVLIIAGLLIKIRTYGKTYGGTRKTPKFLFSTPSLRSAILNNIYLSGIEGKKLEDYFALIFEKDIKKKFAYGLFYDIAEKGADFILTLKDRSNIVIEVGFNKEETEQVEFTMKKVKSRYGLVFGSKELKLVNDSIVKIPLKFLMLL